MIRTTASAKSFLNEQLRKLKEQKVSDLMKEGRIEELEQIAEGLDFSVLKEFRGHLGLKIHEFEEYAYEIAFYVNKSRIWDSAFFNEDVLKDYIAVLKSKEEPLGNIVAKNITNWYLCDLTIKELLEGVETK